MALDHDLQESRRRVAVSPDDPGARLALGATLARSGAGAEAARELWLARVLGAPGPATAPLLASVGARPSPWTSFVGDSELSRRSPLEGPRRAEAEVVASSGELFDSEGNLEAWNLVLAEDGSPVLRTNYALVTLDPTTLAPRATAAIPQAHLAQLAVGPDGRVLVASRGRGTIGVLEADRASVRVLPLESRVHDVAVDSLGHALVTAVSPGEPDRYRFLELSSDLARLDERFRSAFAGRAKLAVHEGLCGLATARRARVLGLDGAEVRSANLEGVLVAHGFAPDGTFVLAEKLPGSRRGDLLLVSGLDRLSRIAWKAPVVSVAIWCELALGHAGAVFVRTREELVKLAGETVAWRRPAPGPLEPSIVLDREDTSYFTHVVGEDTPVLQALGPGEEPFFTVRGIDRPFAIDARGRLLARRGREVVAIA